jgi:hypothetical protein
MTANNQGSVAPMTEPEATAEASPLASAVVGLPFGALCDAPTRDGRCGRVAFKTYLAADGVERGFCVWAAHSWAVTDRYPPAATK